MVTRAAEIDLQTVRCPSALCLGTRGELEEEADARERSEEGGAKAGPAVRSGERLMVFWDSFSCPLGESDDDDPKALDQMALRLRFRLQTLAAAAGCDRELHPTQAAPSHTPTLRPLALLLGCTLRAYAGEGGWLGGAVKRGVFGESTTLVPCANAVEASGALLCDLLCETCACPSPQPPPHHLRCKLATAPTFTPLASDTTRGTSAERRRPPPSS